MKSFINPIDEAINYLGKEYFSSLNISYVKVNNPNELSIIRNGNNVVIKYGQLASLFRGLTIIKIKKDINNYEVHYYKNFNHNGLMHDCSRNGVITVSAAKKYILLSALFGLNRFLLYLEDVYELDGEPYFGYLRGKFTKQELKEIARYGDLFGVEVVPCIQTLSHLNQALRWGSFSNVKETYQTLLTDKEETYHLIEKMIKTCKETFTSNYIHIGMDEAIDFGSGRFIYGNIVIDKNKEFLSHLNKVVKICQKYELKPMMWIDMFFKLNSTSSNWYQELNYLSRETKSLIPDVSLVYWDYYHFDKNTYDQKFKIAKDTNKEVIFAGGSIRWIGYTPNISDSLEISKVGLLSAIKNEIKNVFVTSWGDNGNECSIYSSLPSLALYSTYDFENECDDKALSDYLEAITGDTLEMWKDLELANKLNQKSLPYENPSKVFLYQDPLNGIYDKKVQNSYSSIYKKYAKKLKIDSNNSKSFSYIYDTLSKLCSLLEYKVDIGVKLRKAYQNHNNDELKECLLRIKIIIRRLKSFKSAFYNQWTKENKMQGYDVLDGRLGYLNNRLLTTYKLVNDYLNHKIDNIPELEEIIITDIDNNDSSICNNNWLEIASVNAI